MTKITLPLLLLGALHGAAALSDNPTTNAVCLPVYGWMNNSMGQSPCLFAAYLEGNCGTGYWNINALPQGNVYNGPTVNQSNACFCSSVVYNAVSACGACQGESWVTWPSWKQPCRQEDISDGDYKVSIPPSTSIPRWAYQDPMQQINLSFNVTAADLVAAQNLPDITHASQQGATTTAATQSTKSKTNIGAIVGGVIGGIALVAGIALLTWFLMQRRYESRASQAPSKQYINKWSKDVAVGPPSRWGGTSYAGGSIGGEPMKEVDSTMGSPDGTPYGLASYSTSGPYATSPDALQSTVVPSSTASNRSHGHKKDPWSISSTRSKRGLLSTSPPASNGITPYVLPPLEAPTVVSGRRASQETSAPSERTGAATPFSSLAADTSHRGPLPAELPSTIEYFGSRRPPAPSQQPAPQPMSASRTSLGTASSRPGYYNPDDPSTFPLSAIANDYTFSPTSGHPSNGGQPPSSTFFPNSSMEKLPFGGMNRPYTPQAPGGHVASRGQTPALPPLPGSTNVSPQTERSVNALNMNASLSGSVHTLPGIGSPASPAPRSAHSHTPDPRSPHESPINNAGGIFNSWSKRGRNDSAPPTSWTPHVATTDPGAEFNPYQRQ